MIFLFRKAAVGVILMMPGWSTSAASSPPKCAPREFGGAMWVTADVSTHRYNRPVIDSEIDLTTKFSKTVAAKYYGSSSQIYGYIYGGSGNPYDGLNETGAGGTERGDEVRRTSEAWEDYPYVLGLNATDALLGFASTVRGVDPTYVDDFWSKLGYHCNDVNEQGFTLYIHNHSHEFKRVGNETLFDCLIENTDPTYINFELDLVWVVRAGLDPLVYLEKLGRRCDRVHQKDIQKTPLTR